MKHTPLLLLFAALFIVSCGHKNSITIEGTLENGAGKTIYIEEMSPEAHIFLDSITLDSKGRFKFTYDMPYKTFYNVHCSEANYIVLLPDMGEKIHITGDYNDLQSTYRLSGNGESQLLWQLQDYSNKENLILRDLAQTDAKNVELLQNGELTQAEYDHERAITDSIYLDAFADIQQYVAHFIEDNLGSLTTLIALYKPFNNRPLVNPADSFEFYEAVLEALQEELPDNPHTLNFKNQVERTRFQYAR
ncbi:MAG: DUF4369 domain-containing protein [Bacteroidales bacterium]|nr:DUF4369 domain-containing protein [Candidatus Colimorpha merdihippi]